MYTDDDHTHVIGPDYRREVGKSARGTHGLRLVLTGQEIPWWLWINAAGQGVRWERCEKCSGPRLVTEGLTPSDTTGKELPLW